MREVQNMRCLQICVTNACPFDCANCSQNCPNIPKSRRYFMPLEQVEKALQSLEGWNAQIGMFGGEPTIHPQFAEICKLYQKYVFVKARRELWTAGTKWQKYKKLIDETFYPELVSYNEHPEQQPCYHQPVNVAIKEVFNGEVSGSIYDDRLLLKHLINNCWIQLRWSGMITPKGAYFCEIAAARAYLLDGVAGVPVEKNWWQRPLEDFRYQIESLCPDCSTCIPMEQRVNAQQLWDDVSAGMKDKLTAAGSPKALAGKSKAVDLEVIRRFLRGHSFDPETEYRKRGFYKDFENWAPNKYRLEACHSPNPA